MQVAADGGRITQWHDRGREDYSPRGSPGRSCVDVLSSKSIALTVVGTGEQREGLGGGGGGGTW